MDPRRTALILVGYQNDYFAKDGILRGVVEKPYRVDSGRASTLAFIGTAVDASMMIISTPIILEPDYRALASPVSILDTIKESGAFKSGSPGANSILELLACGDRGMYVIRKVGFNACSNTALEAALRERVIKNVLEAGMGTSLCVDSTVRAA